jgi:hypothetical protein
MNTSTITELDSVARISGKRRYRVGGWELEYTPDRPRTLWAIPEGLKEFRQCSSCIYYGEDFTPPMAWDLPIPPKYVRVAALKIMRELAKEGDQ